MIPETGSAYAIIQGPHRDERHRVIAWDDQGNALIANSEKGHLEKASERTGFQGLGNTVLDTTYRKDQGDAFGAFIDECLEESEGHLVKTRAVYAAYAQWAKNNGVNTVAQQRFRKLLEPKFPGLYHKRAGNPAEWYYGGLRLREGVEVGNDAAGASA
ncbi:primase-like DNA-binding domain-containing protein, partial [Nocardia pseudovaccinii]|uniref:primase-like DNA-binding domain-containing protein n=1 Tax=Nocardia pseudovaccinii TaxID=189540 RepID=UPI000B1EA34A